MPWRGPPFQHPWIKLLTWEMSISDLIHWQGAFQMTFVIYPIYCGYGWCSSCADEIPIALNEASSVVWASQGYHIKASYRPLAIYCQHTRIFTNFKIFFIIIIESYSSGTRNHDRILRCPATSKRQATAKSEMRCSSSLCDVRHRHHFSFLQQFYNLQCHSLLES